MNSPAYTPPIMRAIPSEGPCRYWLSRPGTDASRVRATPMVAEERRCEERRGKGIRIFRFTNERRLSPDRRGRKGRSCKRLPLPVPGEMRHRGMSYKVTTADISSKGARLLEAPPLPFGSLARLTLEPDDDLAEYPLTVWAEVCSFCGERAMLGVRFVGLRPCDARRLSRLVGE